MAKGGSLPVPKGLSKGAGKVWRGLTAVYRFENDSAAQLLLTTALEAYDRMHQARAIIAEKGLMITNRNGNAAVNPLLTIEDRNRKSMLAALHQLGLEPANLEGK